MTLDEVKAYLRITHGAEDAAIGAMVSAARGLCEAFIGQVLIAADFTATVAGDGCWRALPARPVRGITGVAQLAADGSATMLDPALYAIDIDPAGVGWVRAGGLGSDARLRVTYRAGIADSDPGVPAAISQGITRLAAHLYAAREGAEAPPAAVTALWRPFRVMTLAGDRHASWR